MKQFGWELENGEPVFDAVLSIPTVAAGDEIASRRERSMIADWAETLLPADLTVEQADIISCCCRYGHHFGRQVFLRNPYKMKDLIGKIVACIVLDSEEFRQQARDWSHYVFRKRLKHHDVRKLPAFPQVYEWSWELAIDLNAGGWPLIIENYEDVRP